MALSDLDRPKLKEYVKTSIERKHSSDPNKVHKTELSLVDYIKNTFATGFSKNLQLRETKFLGISSISLPNISQYNFTMIQRTLISFTIIS